MSDRPADPRPWPEKAEDHVPDVGSWIDDSTWIICSCGWDAQDSPKVGWWDHIATALAGRPFKRPVPRVRHYAPW